MKWRERERNWFRRARWLPLLICVCFPCVPRRAMPVQQGARVMDTLAALVQADLAKTAHPSMPWLTPVVGPDGRPALDVLIVGGGQSGLAIAFALARSQVKNVLVVDKAEEGREGPWLT